MKKFISLLLALTLAMSAFAFPALSAQNGLDAAFSGIRTQEKAVFTLKAHNSGQSDVKAFVYIAFYDKSAALKNVKKLPLTIPAGAQLVKNYEAPLDGGHARIYLWNEKNAPLTKDFSSGGCRLVQSFAPARLTIDENNIWASSVPEEENAPKNVLDSNTSTAWTASGVSESAPQSITACLDATYYVSRIGLAFGRGSERNYIFSVSVSMDGESFTEILPKTFSAKTNSVQYFDTLIREARFIRVNMLGRTDIESGWVQLSELELFGDAAYGETVFEESFPTLLNWSVSAMDEMSFTDYTPTMGEKLYAEAENGKLHMYDDIDRSGSTDGEKINVVSVKASQAPEEANRPENVLDESFDTKWTAKNVSDSAPATLTLELDKAYYITKTALAFGVGNERVYTYSVALSEDGTSYTTVVGKTSSAKNTSLQEKEVMQTRARYVRFTFYSRADSNDNGWLQVTRAQVFGTENGIDGAGGLIVQRRFTPPSDRGDYELRFKLSLANNPYFSGVSLTDGIISGGADLGHYSALQLRFDNSNANSGKVKVKLIRSNYFNEGSLAELFEKDFAKNRAWDVTIRVSPQRRSSVVTIDDGSTKETKTVGFAYNDVELTRPSRWTGLEVNTLVFNTGAGAKCEMYVSDMTMRSVPTERKADSALNGVVRLEAVRLSTDLTGNAYFGRFITHNGGDKNVEVKANTDPALTRFVEREGLLGCGVSFEAVTVPGYFLVLENDTVVLRKLEQNGLFCARATFMKEDAENCGYYKGTTVAYRPYLSFADHIYDSSDVHRLGTLKAGSSYSPSNATFYLRSEVQNHASDNFYGKSISSQWWTNYPWKGNNPTNDSYNFSALITKNNVIVENGELFLKATKIPSSNWPTDKSGETGISYNKWGKTWERWKGYVGVVSIQNKLYNRQCYIEGSFKQPDSPIGYWNAFWLAGRDSWPPEIDIFEFLSSKYGHSKWNIAVHGEGDKNNVGTTGSGTDLTNGYHTFAMDWGYDYIRFYVDGSLVYGAQNNDTVNFQKNLRLILNTGVGGWEAEPDDTMVWNDGMRCKYIRSYQY